MVVVPAVTPFTTPPLVIVAMEVEEELHIPPLTVLLNVVLAPAQTLDEPLMVPALGDAFTVIVAVDAMEPQVLETV